MTYTPSCYHCKQTKEQIGEAIWRHEMSCPCNPENMADVTVKFGCGHMGERKPFSPVEDPDGSKLAEFLKDRPCTDCFLAEYRAAQLTKTDAQRMEEAYERLAAFGPGVTTVNVITGEEFTS